MPDHSHDVIIQADARRTRDARRTAWGGLALNVFLATGKILVGTWTGSIAVTADGWNNVSDTFSSIVTIVSTYVAAKPADEQHPFGHARFEYIASSVIALGMLIVAFQLGHKSILRILTPEPPDPSVWMFLALGVSIAVKFGMYLHYRRKGKRLVAPALVAASRDSLADVWATGGILLAMLIFVWFDLNIDGPAGLVVSLLIAWSAIDIIRSTSTLLLGGRPSKRLTNLMQKAILETDPDHILGLHDLVIHDYGPGHIHVSGHVELDRNLSFVEAHVVVDRIERKLRHKYGVHPIMHADPSADNDAAHAELLASLQAVADSIVPGLDVHSLHRFVSDDGTNVAAFDIGVPDRVTMSDDELIRRVRDGVKAFAPDLVLWITLDRGYFSTLSADRPMMRVTAREDAEDEHRPADA